MLRGSRHRRAGPQWNRPVDVVINEARIDSHENRYSYVIFYLFIYLLILYAQIFCNFEFSMYNGIVWVLPANYTLKSFLIKKKKDR